MRKKTLIAVVMGGISSEHEISLQSGCCMIQNLDTTRYAPYPILISTQNKWHWPKDYLHYSESQEWENTNLLEKFKEELTASQPDWQSCSFPNFTSFPKADLFLLGLHGKGGEDGTIQGFLELCGQAYTGSNVFASAQCMDKFHTKEVYQRHNILTPKSSFVTLQPNLLREIQTKIEETFGLPVVLKDPKGGSSLGVFLSENSQSLTEHLHTLASECTSILVEEYIKGKEASCGHFKSSPTPFPPTEIRISGNGFFDHQAKYEGKKVEEITPGEFSPELTKQLQQLATKCHEALKLSGVSRTDFLIQTTNIQGTEQSRIYALETNSLPGFTEHSLIPQQAKSIGLSTSELLTQLIDTSLSNTEHLN